MSEKPVLQSFKDGFDAGAAAGVIILTLVIIAPMTWWGQDDPDIVDHALFVAGLLLWTAGVYAVNMAVGGVL